jgi:hypothetical protein
MSQMQLSLAPSGALSFRQQPDMISMRTHWQAHSRLINDAAIRKRRTRFTEGTMHPDPHNFIANPANGSILNTGQFGDSLAPHPCRGCERQLHAYDAESPARPLRQKKRSLLALLLGAKR